MNIEAVIAALGERYDADELAIIERMFREYSDRIPEVQPLIAPTGLTVRSLSAPPTAGPAGLRTSTGL